MGAAAGFEKKVAEETQAIWSEHEPQKSSAKQHPLIDGVLGFDSVIDE